MCMSLEPHNPAYGTETKPATLLENLLFLNTELGTQMLF